MIRDAVIKYASEPLSSAYSQRRSTHAGVVDSALMEGVGAHYHAMRDNDGSHN